MKKPWGRPPKVTERFFAELSDHDVRLVNRLCQVMSVDHSGLLHILLTGSLVMAKELNDREMEGAR